MIGFFTVLVLIQTPIVVCSPNVDSMLSNYTLTLLGIVDRLCSGPAFKNMKEKKNAKQTRCDIIVCQEEGCDKQEKTECFQDR